jgi:peptidyl-prolyl cis-trans isomerase C
MTFPRTPARIVSQALMLLAVACCTSAAFAQPAPDLNEVLVENRWAKVTRGDYESELLRLPPEIRGGFGYNGKRVTDLLVRMLVTKSLAVQARAGDLYKDAEMQRKRALEIDRADASILISKTEDDAAKAFDANIVTFEARAHELYLANSGSFRVPAQISASHILFSTSTHSKEQALKLAQEAQAKLAAGADFNVLAKEISEDPSARQNSGRLGWFDKSKMDKAFTEAAFALKNPGDVSPPVLSNFGYHLIRLDDRRPEHVKSYDEVKAEILAQERKKYIDGQRDSLIGAVRDDPLSKINQPAVDALIPKMDPELVKKANEGAPTPK